MAEDVTYTLVADLKTGSELGRADLSNTNAPTTEVNILQKLPSTLSINQSMEIALHVFEDLALDDKMDYSSVTGATLTGRLINSTDIAITLDASLTISGTGDYIVTAIIAKDIIPVAWTAGVVRLKWELSTASNKSIIFQDQSFIDPAGTQNGTAVTGFKVNDASTTVQPVSTIAFASDNTVTATSSGLATVRNDVTTAVSYEYDNTVAKADPGAGLMRFNHATIASATEIYLDDLDKNGLDNGTFFSNMGTTSTLRFGAVDDPTAGELFTVTSAADETGYWTLVVVHVDSGTVGMLDTKTYGLTYSKSGGGGDALVANPLSQFAATTSAQLAGVLSDETGTSLAVFNTSPTLVTPLLGTPTSGVLTNCTSIPPGMYREIYIDAAAMVPRTTNGAEALTKEFATNDIMIDYLSFDSSTEEGVQFKLTMPDEWDLSTIKFKFYWDALATASGTCIWGVRAGGLANSDAIDTALGTQITVTDTLLTVGDMHISPATAAVTVAGTPALGEMIIFQVVATTGGTISVDQFLMGVSIQYKENTTIPVIW